MLVAFMATQLSCKISTQARPLGSTTDCTAAHGLEDEQSAHASATLPCMDECEPRRKPKFTFAPRELSSHTSRALHTASADDDEARCLQP